MNAKKNEEELLRLQRELEDFSYRDGLTGVANRRMFDQVLARALVAPLDPVEWTEADELAALQPPAVTAAPGSAVTH